MGSVDIPEPVAGWNPVPGDPDSMVWWDGTTFTHEARSRGDRWVVVARERARRRMGCSGWVTLVFGVPLIFLLLGVTLYFSPVGEFMRELEKQVGPSVGELKSEMDGWKLPRTVQRASRADDFTEWTPGSTLTSVTRYYRARGVGSTTAATDLVRALRKQGYSLEGSGEMKLPDSLGTVGFWSGPGKTENTELSISVDDPGQRIFYAELADTGDRSGGGDSADALRREVAGWRLPAALRPVKTPRSLRGKDYCEETLCVYFEAQGIDADTAAAQLAQSLNRQGYDFTNNHDGTADTYWSSLSDEDLCQLTISGLPARLDHGDLVSVDGSCP